MAAQDIRQGIGITRRKGIVDRLEGGDLFQSVFHAAVGQVEQPQRRV